MQRILCLSWCCPLMFLKVVKTKSLWTNGSYSKKQTSVDLGHWELEIISYASMSSLTSWKIKRPYDWVNLWRPTWSITWCWLRGNGISFLANSEFNDRHRKLNTGVHWSIFFFYHGLQQFLLNYPAYCSDSSLRSAGIAKTTQLPEI